MDTPLRPFELRDAAGISMAYASQILSGDRSPSQALAIRIFRTTGHKLGPIAAASNEDIDALERVASSRGAAA